MSSAFNYFNVTQQDVGKAVHDFATDSFKILLSNTLPVAANAVKADLTEISAGNGYSAGGLTIAVTSFNLTTSTAKLILANSALLTATGAVGPFQYAILYNNTPLGKPLIGWWDYGSAITMASGQTFQVLCDATTGVLTIAHA